MTEPVKPVENKPEPCCTPGCGKPMKWKGLCPSCYGVAKRLIEQGKTTWEELADLNMVKLEEKPFMVEFRKRKAKVTTPEGPHPLPGDQAHPLDEELARWEEEGRP